MMYEILTVKGIEYKLRLNTRQTVLLEKQLGCNPLSVFGNGDKIPTVTQMLHILHASLQQYQHNFNFEETEKLFDEWLEDGNVITDFIQIIVDIYKASGILKGDTEKNA